jgi:cyclase
VKNYRIIPCLLLDGEGFVKTRRFRQPVYVGDCFNTVRLFNEKEADELVILDIKATPTGNPPDFDLLYSLAGECFMPVAYGGGVTSLGQMRRLFRCGFEKIAINTAAVLNPKLVGDSALEFGSQSVVVSIDVGRNSAGDYEVFVNGGRKATGLDPVTAAKRAVDLGAGEILLNSIDRDGSMAGYDIPLIRSVADAIQVPLIACGGAGKLLDFHDAIQKGRASAVAAGSLFVFVGKLRAVLITYPSQADLTREVDSC